MNIDLKTKQRADIISSFLQDERVKRIAGFASSALVLLCWLELY